MYAYVCIMCVYVFMSVNACMPICVLCVCMFMSVDACMLICISCMCVFMSVDDVCLYVYLVCACGYVRGCMHAHVCIICVYVHIYVCTSFLVSWSKTLREKPFQDLITFLQQLPTQNWTDRDVEMLVSQAFVLQTQFQSSKAHLRR